MTKHPPYRRAVLFALLSTAAAACMADSSAASEHWPRQECSVGDVRHNPDEHWTYARSVNFPEKTSHSTEPVLLEQTFTIFDDKAPASAFRVALSDSAVANITKVEVQDTQGNWDTVWAGRYRDPLPAGCAKVWFEHSLAGTPKLVNAIRFSFISEKMPMTVAGAGLLSAR
jgi:hypothetical protein